MYYYLTVPGIYSEHKISATKMSGIFAAEIFGMGLVWKLRGVRETLPGRKENDILYEKCYNQSEKQKTSNSP